MRDVRRDDNSEKSTRRVRICNLFGDMPGGAACFIRRGYGASLSPPPTRSRQSRSTGHSIRYRGPTKFAARAQETPENFGYYRLHSAEELYMSGDGDTALDTWAQRVAT